MKFKKYSLEMRVDVIEQSQKESKKAKECEEEKRFRWSKRERERGVGRDSIRQRERDST